MWRVYGSMSSQSAVEYRRSGAFVYYWRREALGHSLGRLFMLSFPLTERDSRVGDSGLDPDTPQRKVPQIVKHTRRDNRPAP